jgi:hypothetical protein
MPVMKLAKLPVLAVAAAAACWLGVTMIRPSGEARVESPEPSEHPASVTRSYHLDGKLERTVVYRLSSGGKPLACDIFDADGVRLLKNRFGYSAQPGPDHGKLVEVQVFDAREPRTSAGGKEMPIRRILHPLGEEGSGGKTEIVDLISPELVGSILGPALAGFNPATGWRTGSSPLSPDQAR